MKIRFAKGRLKMSEPKKGRIKAIFKKEKKKKKKPEGSRHRGWKEWEAVSGAIHPLTLYASLLVGGGGGHSCIGNTHMSVFSFSRTTVGHDESTSSVNGRFSSVNAHHSAPIFAVVFVVFSLRFGFWLFGFLVFLKIWSSWWWFVLVKSCPTLAPWTSKRNLSRRVRVAPWTILGYSFSNRQNATL